jgi:hypothetical protein
LLRVPIPDRINMVVGDIVQEPPKRHTIPTPFIMQYCILGLTLIMQYCIVSACSTKEKASEATGVRLKRWP